MSKPLEIILLNFLKQDDDGNVNLAKTEQQIKDLMMELIGPHASLSKQDILNGRIYVLGDPQADAVDRYKDELGKKVGSL